MGISGRWKTKSLKQEARNVSQVECGMQEGTQGGKREAAEPSRSHITGRSVSPRKELAFSLQVAEGK